MDLRIGRTMCAVAALAICVAWSSSAQAFIFWTNQNGSGAGFDWMGGGSDNGLFGSPTLIGGNTLVFFPSNFRADSLNGSPATTADRLEVTIIAQTSQLISGIQISEFGDYAINGGGEVSVTGTMFITDLINPGPFPGFPRLVSGDLASTPGSPIQSAGTVSGSWTAQVGIDLTSTGGPDWTMIKIVLNNNLFALSNAGGSSFIEKKVVGTGIAITIVPTPGATALLGLGGLFAIRRRR
jgi:hypothetical protein